MYILNSCCFVCSNHSLSSVEEPSPVGSLDSAPLKDPVEVRQVGDLDEGAVLGHGLGRVGEVALGVSEDGVLDARLPFRLRRRFVVVVVALVLLRVVPGGFAVDLRIGLSQLQLSVEIFCGSKKFTKKYPFFSYIS